MSKIIKKVDVLRFMDNDSSSLGIIQLDGQTFCGSVEDQEQKGSKVKGETRVSNGLFRLALRTAGGFHERYKARYNVKTSSKFKGEDWHRGVLAIYNDKDWKLNTCDGKTFQYVLIHIGNFHTDTEACLLPNYVLNFIKGSGSNSGQAYEDLYPILRDSIESSKLVDEFGNKYIEIEYSDIEPGK